MQTETAFARELRAKPPAHQWVENLSIRYPTTKGPFHAVDTVSCTVGEGTTLGLVGESGCGKSTVVKSLLSHFAGALDMVRVPAGEYLHRYPNARCGGQRQRIAIDQVLVLEPKFIVADEPVSTRCPRSLVSRCSIFPMTSPRSAISVTVAR